MKYLSEKIGAQGAQGELTLVRVSSVPKGYKKVLPDQRNFYIVGHSETGHHHVIDESPRVRLYRNPGNDFFQYLEVLDKEALEAVPLEDALPSAILHHLRNYDTHEEVGFNPGIYEIRAERVYTLKGFQKALD